MQMPPIKHAILSASSAHRWMKCTPSAMLEKDMPDIVTEYAAEGSAAHEVAEYKVRMYLGESNLQMPNTGKFNADEIDRHTDSYLEYATDMIESVRKDCPDAMILVEQRLDYSNYVKDGFGTGDLVIVADDAVRIIDFKYGQGVQISAVDNPQMKLYALGALNLYGFLYNIKTVKMSIVQPRLSNISEWEISVEKLIAWAENELRPVAELAAKGAGEFVAGDHCRFCKINGTCRKRAEMMLDIAKYDFAPPVKLSDDEITEILKMANDFSNWVSDVFAYAQARAINDGKQWEGFKVVEGKSNRRYADESKIAEICMKNGYKMSQIYEQKIIGIGTMEKLLGKDNFNNLLGKLVFKPKGKLSLVPETDKRREVNNFSEFMKEEK